MLVPSPPVPVELGQPLPLSGPQTSRRPHRDPASFSGRRGPGEAAGGEATVWVHGDAEENKEVGVLTSHCEFYLAITEDDYVIISQ